MEMNLAKVYELLQNYESKDLLKILQALELSSDTKLTIGTNLDVDGQITQNGGSPVALYEYNIVLNFENKDGNIQYIYFTLLSSNNLELTLDNIKTLIGNKFVMCISTVNDIENDLIDYNTTIVSHIYVNNGEIVLNNISDEFQSDYTNLTLELGRSTVTRVL